MRQTALRPAYVILTKQALIARDIALTIEQHDPGAPLIVSRTSQEAEDALATVPRVATAILSLAPAKYLRSPLHDMITMRKGQVILMGDDAEDAPHQKGLSILHRPFTTEILIDHLCSVELNTSRSHTVAIGH